MHIYIFKRTQNNQSCSKQDIFRSTAQQIFTARVDKKNANVAHLHIKDGCQNAFYATFWLRGFIGPIKLIYRSPHSIQNIAVVISFSEPLGLF